MSFGGFILGALMMVAGFYMVARTNWFLENLGDLGTMIGVYGKSWMSWKLFGVILILAGFMVAFGLFGFFIQEILGGLLNFGR